jgi:pimeloyl-ACP methyl ester carboxylesterase
VVPLGYILVIPDYIGYGESSEYIHPYVHKDTLASASLDMLRQAKITLAEQNILVNEQLFLAGFSEGGFATLAMQKKIEEDLSDEFTITASAPAAGPYDMSTTIGASIARPFDPVPGLSAFFLHVFNEVYQLDMLDNAVSAAYLDQVTTYNLAAWEALEPTTTAAFFTPEFVSGYSGDGQLALKQAVAENDIYNWVPQVPTRFFHGDQDPIVPYFNSQKAVGVMNANGAPDVDLVDCIIPDGSTAEHVNCAPVYFQYMAEFFSGYALDL